LEENRSLFLEAIIFLFRKVSDINFHIFPSPMELKNGNHSNASAWKELEGIRQGAEIALHREHCTLLQHESCNAKERTTSI
jgi:hypothetical protein